MALPELALTVAGLWGRHGPAGLQAARVWTVLRRLHWPGDRMRSSARLLAECRARMGDRELSMGELRAAFVLLQRDGVLLWPRGTLQFPTPARPDLRAMSAPGDLDRRGRINWDTPARISHAQLEGLARMRAPVRFAALLVSLVRCDFDPAGEGRVAAALVARVAGSSHRAAERALAELFEQGWLERLPADPKRRAFWTCGGRLRIGAGAAPRRPRQAVGRGAGAAGKLSGSGERTSPLRSGIQRTSRAALTEGPRPHVPHGRSAGEERAALPAGGPGPLPLRLPELRREQLSDHAVLEEIHAAAARAGRVSPAEPGLFAVATLAQAALRLGRGNPGGLLYHLLALPPQERGWSGEDEERARSLLRARAQADAAALWARVGGVTSTWRSAS